MEVKLGYKQTEVGVLPEEWEVLCLDECVRLDAPICYGILMPGPHCHDGVPVVKVRDIGGGRIDESALLLTHPLIDEAYKRSRLLSGDVLITIRGTTGRVAITSAALNGANITQDTARVRLRDSVFTRFIYYELQSETAQKYILLHTIGQAVKGINIRDVRTLTVSVPPLPEQRAIATALSDVDGLLGGLDRLIAKKRDLKQAAMQQLLTGQTRLPGWDGAWEVKRLGDVASVSKGTQLHSSETDDGGKFAHLNGGITPSSYTHKSNTGGNTIAISEGGNSCGFVQFMAEPYWCGGHCYSVIPNGVDNHFLYHALKGEQSAIMGLRVGSGLPNVQKTGLLDFKIKLPASHPEQTAIASVLTEMDGELAVLEQRREKTRALKQAMMQELLTGRTRLV